MSADSAREAAVALGDEVRSIYLAFGREEDLDWTYQDVVDRVDYTWDVLNGISDYVYMRITFFIIFSLFLAGCYVLRNPISKLIYRLLYGFGEDFLEGGSIKRDARTRSDHSANLTSALKAHDPHCRSRW